MNEERWQSDSITKLIPSLIKARLAIPPIPKKATNPFFAISGDPSKGKYAELSDALDIITPILAAHDLVIVQRPSCTDGETASVDTIIYHASGEWLMGRLMMVPVKKDAHTFCGSITYLKRYGLFAMLSLSGELDDDGNAAQSGVWDKNRKGRRGGSKVKEAKSDGDKLYTGFISDINDSTDSIAMGDIGDNIRAMDGRLSTDQIFDLRDKFGSKQKELAEAGA